MLTTVITNTSGSTLAAGTLPGCLSWVADIANGASVTVVLNPNDLTDIGARTGFTMGDLLQQMVQKGLITVSFNNVGSTDRDVTANATSATTAVVGEVYGTGTGVTHSGVAYTHTLAYLPLPGSVVVTWNKYTAISTENPTTVAPAENGVGLSFVVTLAHTNLTNDDLTLGWDEGGAKTTTLVGSGTTLTPTTGDNANVTSASINRSTGVLTLVFTAGHAPTADSIRVSYNYIVAVATSITDAGDGTWATGAGVSAATVNYATKACSIVWTGATVVPYKGDSITVAYTRLYL